MIDRNLSPPKKIESNFSEGIYSFDAMVWVCVYRIQTILSFDTSNPGRVRVMGHDGTFHDIIRENFRVSFINAVWGLYALLRRRLTVKRRMKISFLDFDEKDDASIRKAYENAKANYLVLLDFLHDYGLFGYRAVSLIIDWRTSSGKKYYMAEEVFEPYSGDGSGASSKPAAE